MEDHPIQVVCPRPACQGTVRIDPDGSAHCTACRTPLGVWSRRPTWAPRPVDPKDWNIQTVSLVNWPRRIAWAAAILCTISLGLWFGAPWSQTEAKAVDSENAASISSSSVTTQMLLSAIRSGELPEGLELPAIYGDPSLIAQQKHIAFSAPSPLVKQWLLLTTSQKREILGLVIKSPEIAWLFAFLGELAYSGIVFESDPAIAGLIRGAVTSTAYSYAPAAVFLLEHIAQVCPHDPVRSRAQENAAYLRDRVGSIGR